MLYHTRKLFSFLLAAALLLSLMPLASFAEDPVVPAEEVLLESSETENSSSSEPGEELSSSAEGSSGDNSSEDLSAGSSNTDVPSSGTGTPEDSQPVPADNATDDPSSDSSGSLQDKEQPEADASVSSEETPLPDSESPDSVSEEEAEVSESPETIRIVFTCSEAVDLSGLTVYDALNQAIDPLYDTVTASFSYGTYDLIPGIYTYTLHDFSGQFENLESIPFTVTGPETEQIISIAVTAVVEEDPFAGLEIHSITVVNPIYSDVVTPADIPAVETTEEECKELLQKEEISSASSVKVNSPMLFSSSRMTLKARSSASSSSLFYTDVSSAGAALKTSLKARESEVRIYYQASDQLDGNALCTSIYANAVIHTGVSTEGDYLRYEYGGYNATIAGPVMLSGTDVYSYLFVYSPLYYTTAEQENAMTGAVNSVLGQLNLSGKSDYDKIKAIYDYLTSNVSYDSANLYNDSYTLKYTGYAALVNRTAVCQGYSAAFYRLCLESGINTRIISSESMCHAWNIVGLGGCYYALDSTWDAGKTDYSWFLKGRTTWLSSHIMNGVSTLGDQYNDGSFSSSYPIPSDDYITGSGSGETEPTPTPVPSETPEPVEEEAVLVYHAEVEATCTESGMLAYWEDPDTGAFYLSEDGTNPVSSEELIVSPLGHSVENGVCTRCGDVFFYSISYELNNGVNAESNPAEYNPDTGASLYAPSRTGYVFDGWYDNSSFTGASVAEIPAGSRGNIVLYAKWIPIRYSIAFDGNGSTAGVMRSLSSVTYDQAVSLTNNAFRRTGYTFLGWSLNSDAAEAQFDNRAAVVNLTSESGSTVILYAVWEPISYTVVFNANGGAGEMSSQAGVCRYDTVYALPECAFTRSGFRFDGWSTSASGKPVYSDGDSITNLSNVDGKVITLYAVWTAYRYDIVFDGNGATSGTMRAMTDRLCGTAYTLTSNSFRRTGFNFAGWNTMPDGSGIAYGNRERRADFASEDGALVTLYAQWAPISYRITYRNVLDTDENANPTSYTSQDDTITLVPISRPGFVFLGWYADSGCRTYLTSIESGSVGNKTIYAKWAAYSYTIVFDANGGTGRMNSLTNRLCSKTYTLTTNTFRRTGYVFSGWNTQPDGTGISYANREKVTALSTANNDIVTLYAQWSLIPYTITYRNVLSTDNNPNPATFVYGQSFPLSDLSRAGFVFEGWYKEASFRNRIAVFNEDLSASRNTTVYAKWTVMKYNIVFDSNSLGRGTVTGTMRPLSNRLCGRTYTLTSNSYRMSGYTFIGWSTDPYADVPMYANRAKVTNLSTINGDTVTLYAVWQSNALRSSY